MVEFFHVAHEYGAQEVLSDVTFTASAEGVLIAGAAGAGKSVLLRLLCGLERPARGWISVDGLPLGESPDDVMAAHRRRLAVLPQRPLLVHDRSVVHNVSLALEVQGLAAGEAHERAGDVLHRLGAAELADRLPGQLSDGERRLVSAARGLARADARVIVADDPVAGLDPEAQARVGDLLAERIADGATLVAASQQPTLAGLESIRVLFLDAGRVTWDSATGQAPGRVRARRA